LKSIVNWLDKLIVKHHKCKNHTYVFSHKYRTDGHGVVISHHVEYRCGICDKVLGD